MNILICGATGFVGRHLANTLASAGHTIFRGVRQPIRPNDIQMDYGSDIDSTTWLPRLRNISVVINAVGVLRDHPNKPMSRLHAETPCALFTACAEAGVDRIVHLSALGTGSSVNTPYFKTREVAESCLNNLPGPTRKLILRPSLIYGHDGASAKLFRLLASLPVHVLPAGGKQALQPVHIDDVCDAARLWIDSSDAQNLTLTATGAEATTLRGMLDSYRKQTGLSPAYHLAMPGTLVQIAAQLGNLIPASPLCSDTLTMLNAGNTGDSAALDRLLGRPPRSYREFIDRDARNEYR